MLPITLTREPLQLLRVDAIGYGAKDTGEMGGGAAAVILAAAGEELLTELRSKLSGSVARVGDVAITRAYNLETKGIRWVLHIVSIIKYTPQGAYCPHPAALSDGVERALTLAHAAGARIVAFSALGTGEGRVRPELAARRMLDGVRRFARTPSVRSEISVTFSLPTHRYYEAFEAALGESR
jgi:O-acetyl-ADP-ribose deacetylase (regulator of RNase III)